MSEKKSKWEEFLSSSLEGVTATIIQPSKSSDGWISAYHTCSSIVARSSGNQMFTVVGRAKVTYSQKLAGKLRDQPGAVMLNRSDIGHALVIPCRITLLNPPKGFEKDWTDDPHECDFSFTSDHTPLFFDDSNAAEKALGFEVSMAAEPEATVHAGIYHDFLLEHGMTEAVEELNLRVSGQDATALARRLPQSIAKDVKPISAEDLQAFVDHFPALKHHPLVSESSEIVHPENESEQENQD